MLRAAPRMVIAGTGSGCGKTTAVCAVLQALKNRHCDVAAFKCGPDYIDPMFHTEVIGTPSANLDLYFSDEACMRALFARHARALNVIEGVMGYYDGMAMDSPEASAWHVANALNAPTVLVVSVHGMALSAAAVVKGFVSLRSPSRIEGVILNHASAMIYPSLKKAIEQECDVRVYGYLPECPECSLESRHLGLVTAQEVENLHEKLQTLAVQAEKNIDLDGLIALMEAQSPVEANEIIHAPVGHVRVAVAKDRAFCFYYRDNLELLQELGAELVFFSPMDDARLPDCDGLILGGGYPELHAGTLSRNRSMRESIRAAVTGGLATIAECGGFMYLTEKIEEWPMAGVIPTVCFNTKRLARFGYAAFAANEDGLLLRKGESVRGHEFHYWDADNPGGEWTARKPSGREWPCVWSTETLYAGYPHLYLYSNPHTAERFVQKCLQRRMLREADGNRTEEL